ncbi:DUF2306 domain-containing protein [Microbacterium sp. W4I20]|uniref:DUF2306 domain-containing protein n=1 Tax=Microbacterium sp. W4I20 TaxID=3042262 RepID=UPI002784689C|nr:DUF2306 domain-containing protein [Microbacterium sp. W4I20]MDQ0726516.1 uncharacterized membrane protein YozB (DUF420 family) [Microbacterium sp. W4I20]
MSPQMKATRPTPGQERQRRRPKSGWPAITGLLLLSALPVLGGVLRLTEVSAGAEGASPLTSTVALIAHIVSMTVFCLIGAFQFSPALRTRHRWHRAAGRVLIPAGFLAASSALWLAVFFGGHPDELALAMIRLVFAVAMTVFLLRSVIAIRRRDFAAHGAWMTRAYAIAVSGGTQALVFALWTIPLGEVDAFGEAWLVAAAFVINSAVAELLIRRRAGRQRRTVSGRGALVS